MFANRLCARALFPPPKNPCDQSDIWNQDSIIFKRKKKEEVLSCQDCFLIRDNKPQDSNCECSNNGSIYTNLLCDINMKPTHSNNMNCCWLHVNKMGMKHQKIYIQKSTKSGSQWLS